MSLNVNTSINDNEQTSINNVFQSANSQCTASCRQRQDGVNVIVSNSKTGNITLSQTCQANALCVMRTNLDTIAQQQLTAKQNAEASAQGSSSSGVLGWLGIGVSVNTSANISKQTLENSTTQIINNNCNSTVDQIQQNINILVSDNAEVGQVDLSQTGDATASCAISSAASAKITQSGTSDQTATALSGSVWATIIIGLAIVLFLLYFLTGDTGETDANGKKITPADKITSATTAALAANPATAAKMELAAQVLK